MDSQHAGFLAWQGRALGKILRLDVNVHSTCKSPLLGCRPARPQEFENCGRLKMDKPKNRPFFRVWLGPTSNRALGPSRSLPSHHHHHSKLTWTEPAKCWRKAFLLACVIHTVPKQNIVASLALPSIIVHSADTRKNRKPRANSIFRARLSRGIVDRACNSLRGR